MDNLEQLKARQAELLRVYKTTQDEQVFDKVEAELLEIRDKINDYDNSTN